MKWLATVLILACSLLIFSDYSSAGSTGDSPPEDGVWTINQPTFVWDEVIDVDGLLVNAGSLTLENCNVVVRGDILIDATTLWTNSSVHYYELGGSDEFVIQSHFTIENTKILVNLTGWNNEGIKIYSGSTVTIRDYDDDPTTIEDRSEIKGDWKQNGYAFFIYVAENVQFSASNSFFGNMSLINMYSPNAVLTNNSFNFIYHALWVHNQNLLFDNNTLTEVYGAAISLHSGDSGPMESAYAVIKNNTFSNRDIPEYWAEDARFVWAGSGYAKIFNNIIEDSHSALVFESSSEYTYAYSNSINNITYFCINVLGNHSKIWDNKINDCRGVDGIWINAWNVEVYDNEISLCLTPLMSGFESGYGITTSSVFRNTREDFRPSNISIHNNTIKDSLRGILADYDIDDVKISDNIITNVTEGIKIASAEADECTRVPSNVIVSRNTLDSEKGIIVIDVHRQAGCFWGAHNYTFYGNIIVSGEIGFEFVGNSVEKAQFFRDIELKSNVINSTTAIIVRHIDGILIDDNKIESENGISLIGSLSAEITNNVLNSSFKGIIVGREIVDKPSTGSISFNDIAGTGSVGIQIDDESIFHISDNNISLYSNGIIGNFSELTISGNLIKYSDNAIYILKSVMNIESNSFLHTDNGIYAINSSLEIADNSFFDYDYGYYFDDVTYTNRNNNFGGGAICYYLLDTEYFVNEDGIEECNEYLLISSFRFNLIIKGDSEEPLSRDFRISNSFNNEQLWNETNPQGSSEIYVLKSLCLNANGESELYNPYTITAIHNNLPNQIDFNLTQKQTMVIILDTTAPQSELTTGNLLVNYNTINLDFNMISSDEERNYLIQYLPGESSGFYEWVTLGPYTEESVTFNGEDGFSYRFRSIATDINGNQEVKSGYDFEIEFDLTPPSSSITAIDDQDFFLVDGFKFYFRNTPTFDFQWFTDNTDVSYYEIKAYHSPRMDYINFDDFIWNKKYNEIYLEQEIGNFTFPDMGIYSFSIKCTDLAGNSESKNDYDFYVLYDAIVDNVTFSNVPANWGSDEITIEYLLSDPSSDYSAYLAFEPVDQKDESLEWYSVPFSNSEDFSLSNLNDRMRYFVYITVTDRAGNVNNPLNTTQYFSSSGDSNQVFDLDYLPLEIINGGEFLVFIDQDLDGTYTKTLQRSETLSGMKANDYFVDYSSQKLYFGTSDGVGFIPEVGENMIKVQYTGYHFAFNVYTRGPQATGTVEYVILDHNMTNIMWYNEESTTSCKIQRTTNISKGWFNQKTISPCDAGNYTFIDTNLRSIEYKYRILYIDAFGHEGATSFASVDMTTYQVQETNEATTTLIDPNLILPASILALLITLVGAFLAYRLRAQEETLLEQESIVDSRPVAKYKIEELYLIYQDGRLLASVSGSETTVDSDIMSGMLTAINDFVQDSFTSDEDLGSIDYGQNKIVLERGRHYYLAAVVYGKVDRFIRAQLANALRMVATNCPHLENWDGDSSQNNQLTNILNPIMMETNDVTREMVDNYITKRQVSVTSKNNIANDFLYMKINISNYSSNKLELGKIKPVFDDRILSLHGVKPDVLYSFNDNSFQIGEIKSYTEIKFDLTFKIKQKGLASIDVELNYFVKDKSNKATSRIFDGQL